MKSSFEIICELFIRLPFAMLGASCLILFFIFYFIQYIYISFNLKKICKVVFNDERHFRLPLEPFNCFFISVLPIVFWRETLNIKYGISFKKLYGKEFYYPIDQVQLKWLLRYLPLFFYIQYIIFFSSMFFMIFGGIFYISNRLL